MKIALLLIGIEYSNIYKLDGTLNDIKNINSVFTNYYDINSSKDKYQEEIIKLKNNNINLKNLFNKLKNKTKEDYLLIIKNKQYENYIKKKKLEKLINMKIDIDKFILTDNIKKIKNLINENDIVYDNATSEKIKYYLNKLNKNYKNIHIYYSGHGSNINDLNKDEKDGKDECIVPSDINNLITDDYLYKNFIKKLKKNTKCRIIIDCCHSGTIFDLQYVNNRNKNINKTNTDVIVISGCMDRQKSYETYIKNKVQGVLTFNLCKCLSNKNNKLNEIYMIINDYLLINNYHQNLTISSTKPIINKNFMLINKLI